MEMLPEAHFYAERESWSQQLFQPGGDCLFWAINHKQKCHFIKICGNVTADFRCKVFIHSHKIIK